MQVTHSEYANAALPPVEPAQKTPIEQAAELQPQTPERHLPTGPAKPAGKPLSGGFIAAVFVVLLIGLAITASFRQGCFARRNAAPTAVPTDTISSMMNHAAAQASTPPVPPTAVPPGEVPPEALVVPQEEPPPGRAAHSGVTNEAQAMRAASKRAPRPVLITPSNFAAEEELAKLHADGNTDAYMSAVHRQSGVTYRVYSHR